MSERVYTESVDGYVTAMRLLEEDGLIELGHADEFEAGAILLAPDDTGTWGYAILEPGLALLEDAGYADEAQDAGLGGAVLLWARLRVEDGNFETIEDALRNPLAKKGWLEVFGAQSRLS